MKNQENVTPSKNNKGPGTDPKEMEIFELSDKEFRIILIRKFSELQENTNWQVNEIRKTMHVQNEKFDKEIRIIKKKPKSTENPRVEKYNWTEEFNREFQK